jgi:guanine nucleotide-binding protein subunit alpha
MKLIYAQGFSKNEKMEWKPVVFTNIIQSFRAIYDAMNEMGIKFENPENEASLRLDARPSSAMLGAN